MINKVVLRMSERPRGNARKRTREMFVCVCVCVSEGGGQRQEGGREGGR